MSVGDEHPFSLLEKISLPTQMNGVPLCTCMCFTTFCTMKTLYDIIKLLIQRVNVIVIGQTKADFDKPAGILFHTEFWDKSTMP